MSDKIFHTLVHEPLRKELVLHPLITQLKSNPLSFEQVKIILAQWYHPLHYFPTFLAHLIGLAPSLNIKTHISKILWQELGEGNVVRSHEHLYEQTMQNVGFKSSEFIAVMPLKSTTALVQSYKESTESYLTALGYAFGTETADLVMVSSIGYAVKILTGAKKLEWVEIHVKQEPDHVNCVNEALASELTADESQQVIDGARSMWKYWISFFDGLAEAINSGDLHK